MAMDFEAKQQILFDSFNVFKDNWEANSDTLTSAISKIAITDVATAIQMWTYLLTKHSRKIKSDSKITSGILDDLPSESYTDIANNSFLIEKLFKLACEPWESVSLITHFLGVPDFATAARLLDLISKNTTVSEYNYTDYKSSNLSTCLYKILDHMYNFSDNDIEFLSDWIERVSDNNEQMKLKVLLISKEATESMSYSSSINNRKKNDYLLEGASLEELDMASSRREDFEIKKIVEKICDYTIQDIDLSRLDVKWIFSIFQEQSSYSADNFNLIGAYFWLNGLSWETKSIVQDIYKNQVPVKTIAKNSYRGDTEATIRQRLDLVSSEISSLPFFWNFSFILGACERIISLSTAYDKHLAQVKVARDEEIAQYADMNIGVLEINTRIKNILAQNKIQVVAQLVDVLDSGIHLEGLGDKSVKTLKDKIESFGIRLSSVNDDINFFFRFLGIDYDAYALANLTELNKIFNLSYNTFGWYLSRSDLKIFIKKQFEIAISLSEKFSGANQDLKQNLENLRKDSETIYVPGQYFFREISKNITRF